MWRRGEEYAGRQSRNRPEVRATLVANRESRLGAKTYSCWSIRTPTSPRTGRRAYANWDLMAKSQSWQISHEIPPQCRQRAFFSQPYPSRLAFVLVLGEMCQDSDFAVRSQFAYAPR